MTTAEIPTLLPTTTDSDQPTTKGRRRDPARPVAVGPQRLRAFLWPSATAGRLERVRQARAWNTISDQEGAR